MRRLISALTVAAGIPVFLVVPVVSLPGGHPHAVTPAVETLAVPPSAGSPGAGPHGAGPHRVLAHAERPHAHPFELVGATWRTGSLDPGAAVVQVRVHQRTGWSDWTALAPQDGGADGGSADAVRAARLHRATQAADPVWVGDSDGVQARVVGVPGEHGKAPGDLHVVLVDGGSSPADAHPQPAATLGGSVAAAAAPQPTIYSRADWGADENMRRSACPSGPDYSPTIKMGFIHHTDSPNGYSRAQVPAMIRSMYAYHVRSNGWCDIGYNFLVDRFGRIWEGRYGGITKAVIGAHTGGFNTDTFGASLIGNFTKVAPSAAMLGGVEQLFAWKLARYYRDPTRTATLVAGSFSGSRYRTGSDVTFRAVSGHRDADFTTCPGNDAYADLTSIRTQVRSLMGAGFVGPTAEPTSTPMGGAPVTVSSKVLGAQSWQLTVTDSAGGPVTVIEGAATRSTGVSAAWDLTDDEGAAVLPGTYNLRLTGTDADGHAARPWQTSVTVTPPVTLAVPGQVSLGQPVKAHGRGVPGHLVAVTAQGPAGTQSLGPFTVDEAGKWSAGTSVVNADGDLTWTAADQAVPDYVRTRTTQVGPTVLDPTDTTSYVNRGSALDVRGSALPGVTVSLTTQPDGGAATAGPDIVVGTDGSWSTSFVPVKRTTYWVTDSRGLESVRAVAVPVDNPTASAPTTGYADRRVPVEGNAGRAPVTVTLAARPAGGTWTAVTSAKAARDGHYALHLPLDAPAGSAVTWRISTRFGSAVTGRVSVLPVFAPTATGPARTRWNVARTVTGTAVPGDRVSVWAAPAGSSSWTVVARTRAAGDTTWSVPVRFARDTDWQVRSPSGRSAVTRTVVVPSITAPATSTARQRIAIAGLAIPGTAVTLFRQSAAGTWAVVRTVTADAAGRWSVPRRLRSTASFRAESHGQSSRTITVVVA